MRIPAHQDNLRRGSASCFTMEAVSAFMEISRVGLNPPDLCGVEAVWLEIKGGETS